jgi:preprotein translocase subunit SecG
VPVDDNPVDSSPLRPVSAALDLLVMVVHMVTFLDVLLAISSVLMVLLILLHRAKGGGLSSLFGGGVQSSLSGSTVVEKNLDRLTVFVSAVWVISILGVCFEIKYA